jgi:hypothetical protein
VLWNASIAECRSSPEPGVIRYNPLVYCSFYIRKGIAYVPTTAKTEAGYWMAIEPVDVAPVPDATALKDLLLKAMARGNPVVPTPTRANFPRPIMERYSGMKSFSAFERTAKMWSISGSGDSYSIYPWQRSARYRGAWEEDSSRKELLPVTSSPEEVARRAADLVFADLALPPVAT